MRKGVYLFLIILFSVNSCVSRNKKVESHPCNYERIAPFGVTSTTEGFYIYPYGENINKIVSANFYFWRPKEDVWNDCYSILYYRGPSVTYPTLGKHVLFVSAVSEELYGIDVYIKANTKCGVETYRRDSGFVGLERVKDIPFKDFDSPELFFTAILSKSNRFYYGGHDKSCRKLDSPVKKYIPVFIKERKSYGCYTLPNTYGVYCDTLTGSVKVYPGKIDRFYSLLWEEDTYRIYILKGTRFMIYDFFTETGDIKNAFEEDNVRDVFPGLSHTYNKLCHDTNIDDFLEYELFYSGLLGEWSSLLVCNSLASIIKKSGSYISFIAGLRKRKYFYLLKTTDETMVEILKPDLTKDFKWYWKPVSGVSYYFMEVTLPIMKREDYLPRGVIFKDGSVYLEDFRREYKFPFKIKKLWMVKYPEKIWDGNYSGFMVGSDGYMVLVSDATHFDYVKIRNYEEVRDINWFSIVGKDDSFNSLVFLYQKRFRNEYRDMCLSHNLSCNNLYFCCDQSSGYCVQGWTWDRYDDISPFLPSTRKWVVDCGKVQPKVFNVGK